jgi:hypothetical protein
MIVISLQLYLILGHGVFKHLWTTTNNGSDHIIDPVFGRLIGNIAKRHIPLSKLKSANLNSVNPLEPRTIKAQFEKVHAEGKKMLGYWNEFLVDGKFPSGKNEDDALAFCIWRLYTDTNEVAIDIASDDEDDHDGEDAPIDDDGALELREEEEPMVEGDNLELGGGVMHEQHELDPNMYPVPDHFKPSVVAMFVMFGPYSKHRWGEEPDHLFSLTNESLRGGKKSGRMASREDEDKVRDRERSTTDSRGAPSAVQERNRIDDESNQILAHQVTTGQIKDNFDMLAALLPHISGSDKEALVQSMLSVAKEHGAIRLNLLSNAGCNRTPVPQIPPPYVPPPAIPISFRSPSPVILQEFGSGSSSSSTQSSSSSAVYSDIQSLISSSEAGCLTHLGNRRERHS